MAENDEGEDALRAMIPELIAHGVALHVVSGDMIDGTIIVQLLERRNPDAVTARRPSGTATRARTSRSCCRCAPTHRCWRRA